MYVGPLSWRMSKVIFHLLRYINSQSHPVQRPLIPASDTLQHSCKAWLQVNNSCLSGSRYFKSSSCSQIWFSPVRKDCGLKSPESQTTAGRTKSRVQPSSSWQLHVRSLNLWHKYSPTMQRFKHYKKKDIIKASWLEKNNNPNFTIVSMF